MQKCIINKTLQIIKEFTHDLKLRNVALGYMVSKPNEVLVDEVTWLIPLSGNSTITRGS